MLGSLVTSLSQRMVRMATMALMISGAGVAGYSVYLQQAEADPRAGPFVIFFKENAKFFLILGAVGIVVGGLLNFLMARRMQKKMMGGMGMGGMGAMGGLGGMPPGMMGMTGAGGAGGMDPQTLQAMQQLSRGAAVEVVKVRCKACSSLELEAAAFCSKCGKPMA